ncbi:MAG: hypothetical protein P8Z68_00425 [Kineosporiaceae bacterium]
MQNLLVDQGVLGLFLYLTLCLALLVLLTRPPSVHAAEHALPARGVLTFLLVHGLTVEYMVAPVTASFTWFLLVAVWAGSIHRLTDAHPSPGKD